MSETTNAKPPFLRRVRIRNFKSIAYCDVTLEPLTILVGRNGTGKSNFIEALAFLRDCVDTNLERAIRDHGGWDRIHRKDAGEEPMEIGLEFYTGEDILAYKLNLSSLFRSQKIDKEEHASLIQYIDFPLNSTHGDILIKNLVLKSHSPRMGADLDVFNRTSAAIFHAELQTRRLYNFNLYPTLLKLPKEFEIETPLKSDGSNIASVLRSLKATAPETFDRIAAYLRTITGNIDLVGTTSVGQYEIIDFKVDRGDKPLEFDASGMSDGTLRAVFQTIPPHGPPSLVAIEEPETGLHPSAMQTLLSAFDEATLRTQVLITTHSPQMLEAEEVRPENIRVVQMIDGQTWIGPIDRPAREIIKKRFNTLSELEAVDRLSIDEEDLARQQRESKQEASV